MADKGEHLAGVEGYEPPSGTDKVMRLRAQTAVIEGGFMRLPRDAHWLPEYIRELTAFPGSKYDDQVDSTTQALDHFKKPDPHAGYLEYYRLQAERIEIEEGRNKPHIPVRSLSDHYVWVVSIIGKQYNVPPGGTVLVNERELPGMLQMGFEKVN